MFFQLLAEKQAILDHQAFELKKKEEAIEKKEEDRKKYERERSIRHRIMKNGDSNQQQKIAVAGNQPIPTGIILRHNNVFLNYQKNQSEQKEKPYYYQKCLGQILCQCPNFPLAMVDEAKGWIKCQKTVERKENVLYSSSLHNC